MWNQDVQNREELKPITNQEMELGTRLDIYVRGVSSLSATRYTLWTSVVSLSALKTGEDNWSIRIRKACVGQNLKVD